MVKLSKTSKLGCLSWSLQALDTCPGSKKADGSLVDACTGCYATTGFYRMGTVVAPRLANQEDWKREEWVSDMVEALKGQKYFRWFDSGDMYTLSLAEKILEVMQKTPETKHWLPTRMEKFEKYREVLASMRLLHNVVVRFSSDSVTGEYTSGLHGSVIIPDSESAVAGVSVCGAYQRDGKCGDCRACWSKNVAVIAYPAHGRKMIKILRAKTT